MPKYKPETYRGYRIEFVYKDGLIWARAPKLTRQFLSVEKTKTKALKGAERSIRTLLAVST